MHTKKIITGGQNLRDAKKALILVHGRGGTAQDILQLTQFFQLSEFSFLAPQATNNTWYPLSFLAPPQQNEPWLTSALDTLEDTVNTITGQGIDTENIYFLGFSQGACLSLEFVARTATKLGGVMAFTGGLIGDKIYEENYAGDFDGTPIFLSTGTPDPHVPLQRVHDSVRILENHKAKVELQIYPDRPHTISQDEIAKANKFIFEKQQ